MTDENEVKALADRLYDAAVSSAGSPSISVWETAQHAAREALRWRDETRPQQPAALAVPAGWRVMWFTGSFKRGSERWEIYDPEGNGGAVDKSDIRDDMVWGLLDALAAERKGVGS